MRGGVLNLNEVRAFVTVARAGSVQTAARKLHMTQSAVSRLVQRLEADLGAILFDRLSKPLSLTSDGRIALDHANRLLGSAEAFAEALAPAGAPCGILRIGTAHALAEVLVDRPLDLLRTKFPDVTLQVCVDWAAPLVERVENADIHAAVITLLTDAAPRTELPRRLIGKDVVRIIGGANFSSNHYKTLGTMNAVGWAIQPRGCGYRYVLEKALEDAGIGPPNIIAEAFGKDLHLSLVSRHRAFSLMPASEIAKLPSNRDIKTFSCADLQAAISTWFVRGLQSGRMSKPLDEIEKSLMAAD